MGKTKIRENQLSALKVLQTNHMEHKQSSFEKQKNLWVSDLMEVIIDKEGKKEGRATDGVR